LPLNLDELGGYAFLCRNLQKAPRTSKPHALFKATFSIPFFTADLTEMDDLVSQSAKSTVHKFSSCYLRTSTFANTAMLTVRRSALYTAWFRWYSRRAFKKYFDKVRVRGARDLATMNLQTPIIFYLNHSYWWDGFWSQLLTETYFNQNLYIIIEYKQLVRYQFFTRLGAFSIVRENPREAIKTIQYATEKLTEPSHRQNALWIFPQGMIEHVDKRPIKFFSGTAKIAEQVLERTPSLYLCSAVTRIDYLEEQKPELFISFHTPRLLTKDTFPNPKLLTKEMQDETESHLDDLKHLILSREFESFETLIEGTRSVNRWFDSLKATFGISTDAQS